MSEKKTITPKQCTAIVALLQGLNVRATAKAAGVSERTVNRWKSDPDFRLAFDQARQKAFDDAIAKLASMVDVAVEKLRAILSGDTKPDHGMLRAIEICLREARSTEEIQIRQAIKELKEAVERG